MAHLCHEMTAAVSDSQITEFVSSSGGNAGLAVATVAQKLQIPVAVIVPKTTKTVVIDKLKGLGATVTVFGENWNAADGLAREMTEKDATKLYISPYDHPLLWTGHSSVVDELQQQLGVAPAAILVSVGGGGLLCGVLVDLGSILFPFYYHNLLNPTFDRLWRIQLKLFFKNERSVKGIGNNTNKPSLGKFSKTILWIHLVERV